MGTQTVLIEDFPEARVLTLNRSDKLNAANVPLQETLRDRVREAAADPAVRAVIITGAGRAFCAGGDLEMLKERMSGRPTDPSWAQLHNDMCAALASLEVPLIIALNGLCVGMGAEIASYGDIQIMAEDAYFCEPHARFGMGPLPGVVANWGQAISQPMLNELVFTARRLGAAEAHSLGLVNRVVPNGQALEAALALARDIAANPIEGVRAAKRALRESLAAR